jgi:hypothetical protein
MTKAKSMKEKGNNGLWAENSNERDSETLILSDMIK